MWYFAKVNSVNILPKVNIFHKLFFLSRKHCPATGNYFVKTNAFQGKKVSLNLEIWPKSYCPRWFLFNILPKVKFFQKCAFFLVDTMFLQRATILSENHVPRKKVILDRRSHEKKDEYKCKMFALVNEYVIFCQGKFC